MPASCLKKMLRSHLIDYTSIQHEPAYTAKSLLAATGVDADILAKTVVLHVDGVSALAVMTASAKIRWDKLCRVMGTDFIELADESEFAEQFPGCELGAIPPFGSLFGMTVYLDQSLAAQSEIAFSAGTHDEIIKISMQDYKRLAKPIILEAGFIRSTNHASDDVPPLAQTG